MDHSCEFVGKHGWSAEAHLCDQYRFGCHGTCLLFEILFGKAACYVMHLKTTIDHSYFESLLYLVFSAGDYSHRCSQFQDRLQVFAAASHCDATTPHDRQVDHNPNYS